MKQHLLIGNILFATMLFALLSCNHFEKNKTHQAVPDANIAKGKKLAAAHCQSCHQLPDPSLLDTKSWDHGVLPGMGPRLGIFNMGFTEYPSSRYNKDVDSNYYPKAPVVSMQDWQYIIDYYTSVSPDTLITPPRQHPTAASPGMFSIELPVKTGPAATCLVKIDTTAVPHRLYTSDMLSKQFSSYNNGLQLNASVKTSSPVVDVAWFQNKLITSNIGIFNPNDGKHGSAGVISFDEKGVLHSDSSGLLTTLARPVQVTPADFNGDGKMDFLVCEFGNLSGALSWMENNGSNTYTRHVIKGLPGAIKAYIQDVNHDGLPDIWALFAQGNEGIFLYTNKGKGVFAQEEIMAFPAIYGSSYFEFADFNKDGHPDIIYTCGDNADYSPVLKPYHGVYILMNDGSNHFKQAYFFSMHGCFKAMAGDFNGDGNTDIVAISFFADYSHHPEESFIYLENKGNLDFQPYAIPGTAAGRWLTMDVGDLDADGKPDVVLGNFSIAPAKTPLTETWKQTPAFMFLKNISKK